MAGISINTFPYLILGNAPFTISGEVANYGSSNVTNFDINYSINGGAAVSENITGVNIDGCNNYTFIHGTYGHQLFQEPTMLPYGHRILMVQQTWIKAMIPLTPH